MHADAVRLVVTASSDGAVRLWSLVPNELEGAAASHPPNGDGEGPEDADGGSKGVKQVGRLVSMVETGNRITCLGAFVMDGEGTHQAVNGEGTTLPVDEDEDDSQSEDEDSE